MNILAGIHAVKHALEAGEPLQEVVIEKGKTHPRLNELIHLARKVGIHVSFLPRAALDRMANGTLHQGVVAKVRSQKTPSFEHWLHTLDMHSHPLILLLDSVTDPHNLGACLRSAEAAGCRGVILPSHRSAALTTAAAKAASGAAARLSLIYVSNLVRAIKQMQVQGFMIFGLAGEGKSPLFQMDLTGSVGLVVGSEEKGLRRLVRETCDDLVHIPMLGQVESLNVSVAAGVALFEAVRQRRHATSD